MSVLKIKDQNNNWTQIPTIKGDKGDPFTYADFTTEQLESLKGKDGISPTVSVASDTSEDYRLSFTDETHTVTTPNLIPEAEKIFDVYPHDTASGSIASFSDGADGIPLKSCIVRVEPVQDLHGYDYPWPAGGGKNKLPNTYMTTTINGVTFTVYDDGSINVNGTATGRVDYYLSGSASGGSLSLPEGSYILTYGDATLSTAGLYLQFNKSGMATTVYNSASFEASELGWIRLIITTNGAVINNVKIYPMIRLASESDATFAPYSNICPITGWTGCVISHSGADTSNPTTYPITFPAEAGTVYGGTLDVTTGELVVNKAMVDLGTLNWTYTGTTIPYFRSTQEITAIKPSDGNIIVAPFLCTAYVIDTWWHVVDNESFDKSISLGWKGHSFLAIKDTDYTDATAFKEAMSGVQLCYELATPITYQLTPTEIRSLLGQNNLWANTGDTEVEYRASTKMYIDRKITEAVASALNS